MVVVGRQKMLHPKAHALYIHAPRPQPPPPPPQVRETFILRQARNYKTIEKWSTDDSQSEAAKSELCYSML